jgi:hypothetical protein
VAEQRLRGVAHHYSTEQLLEFRDVAAVDKLTWLEEMKELLTKALSPERIALLERFRRGDL